MSDILSGVIRSSSDYYQLSQLVRSGLTDRHPLPIQVNGLCAGAEDAALIALYEDTKDLHKGPMLLICADEKTCSRKVTLFRNFGYEAATFISRDLNFTNVSASHDFESERIRILSGIVSGAFDMIALTPDTALGLTIPKERLIRNTLKLDIDQETDPEVLTQNLLDAGYVRVELVESPGQFARRGGIIDIFPPSGTYETKEGESFFSPYPVRLEFFGDEIDRMGLFNSETQRIRRRLVRATLPPTREVLPDKAAVEQICHIVSTRYKNAQTEGIRSALLGERTALEEGIHDIRFADKYISVIYPEMHTVLDYFSERTLVCVLNTSGVAERMRSGEREAAMQVSDLLESGTIVSKYAVYTRGPEYMRAFLVAQGPLHIDNLSYGISPQKLSGLFGFRTRQVPSYAGRLPMLSEDLTHLQSGKFKILIEVENEISAENLKTKLTDEGFKCDIVRPDSTLDLSPNRIRIIYHLSLPAFELIGQKVIVLSLIPEARAAGYTLKTPSSQGRKRRAGHGGQAILSYADLQPGDLVVHEIHGIGRYTGMETITQDGVTRDYIRIQYAGTNQLFLPVDRLHMVSKYIGSDAEKENIKLSSFSGESWTRAKNRARASVKEMAKELVQLYATRMRRPGFAFPPDDDYQADFDAAFEYQETDSQLNAIEDIKADMEKATPMDRLLCGDVGFGKTEVALRAAYKAVLAGKQVAILVPTTILALQHLQTVSARMQPFGVNVDMVSRFRTTRQIEQTLRALRRGEIDIIIGTHRLISSDVQFKDLGLLIVDEEQRFGVAQKEKIKQKVANVDVLTLSATPIPRTLNMAMGGIRDISVLDEAPGDRVPVQTYVVPYDEKVLYDAIRREMRRGGQSFWLHNDIDTITEVAFNIKQAIPEANVVTAHGRMSKEELEDIWAAMIQGTIDVLVCTTIIETGIDIPNANTLIVENAYRMGLSQLHQLRGRVGRSSRRAYAYLTYPEYQALTEISEKRLEALRDFTDFGAGFQIALRDLELRGAGNMLGAEQSGHLEAIGYDLFIKMLNRAVLEEQGKEVPEEPDCQVSISCDAFIPETYVSSSTQRIALYKRMAMVETEEDQKDILDELKDRYGKIPKPALNLVDIALIRTRAAKSGIVSIQQDGRTIRLIPKTFQLNAWMDVHTKYKNRLRIVLTGKTYFTVNLLPNETPGALLLQLFKDYMEAFDALSDEEKQSIERND
ncbi:MAG: transcription-repair coupling factor [Clostridia bacterium]|nr:transcription-repair coupling factor [Clostridia bacterium]